LKDVAGGLIQMVHADLEEQHGHHDEDGGAEPG